MDTRIEHKSNQELLSTIAGAAEARKLVEKFQNLNELAVASLDELSVVPGVGESKAKAIKSAFLLAQRMSSERYSERPTLDSPEKVADVVREQNRMYRVERFQVALLNTRRRLIGLEVISDGTLDTVLVHPREVFAPAIAKRASALILIHNHPSGDPSPSEADIKVTRDLIRAGQQLKLEVLDHIIMGKPSSERVNDFVSLRELGYFYS